MNQGMDKITVERYCRQMILPAFGGVSAQMNLLKRSALIVGAGGLGSPVGLYLAGAGVGRLGICDADVVDLSNLHRQIAHSTDSIGMEKTESLKHTITSLNPTIEIVLFKERITRSNAKEVVSTFDVVVDCTDNADTRYVLGDICALVGKPLVSGAAIGLDGQITTYCWNPATFGLTGDCGPCLRCVFPDPPPSAAVGSCDMSGVLGPVPGMIGALQAMEVIRILTGKMPNYHGRMLIYSASSGQFRNVQLRPKRLDCLFCSGNSDLHVESEIEKVGAAPNLCAKGLSLLTAEERVDCKEFDEIRFNCLVIDVRPQSHSSIYSLPSSLCIPLRDLSDRANEIDRNARIICICRRGNDSQRAVKLLQSLGIQAQDVIGGLHAYANINSTVPRY